ncbi:hypothetical protein [Nonomuraea basaltis]|uniref:hypothetical protein n=1 Tax=Nonomuraea basaltis TaxID=2495887 RepID=UPI00110C4A76|nr:hypothetical protein [Nonomuraea basaltis]TMR92855.1 hypothetical protein EJK15_42635 [Nonomuraea basaltis]
MTIEIKVEPYQRYFAIAAALAFFVGLIIFGGVWALVIAVVCLFVGTAFGLVVGAEFMRRDLADEMAALRAQYDAASELAYKLNTELQGVAQRAESAERDLIATVAEKTSLRAQLDGLQADGTA